MVDGALIPDLVVSGAAATGLLIVRSQIGPGADSLIWRFRLILLLSALFYMVRMADWLFALGMFRFLTVLCAAAIPFAALLLAEGILRRHAPRWIKTLAAAGLTVFILVALAVPVTRTPDYLTPFLIYQVLLFATSLALIITRDRDSLSAPENRLADRVMIVGPFVLGLLVTDYRVFGSDALGLPALSGLGALMIAWIASTSEARAATGVFIAQALGLLALVSVVSALAIGAMHGWSGADMAVAAAMLASVLLAFMVWLSSAALRRARTRASLERALSCTEDLTAYLGVLSRQGLSEGYALLGHEDLRDYDGQLLVNAMGPGGACTQADLPRDTTEDTRAESQLRALLNRFAARDVFLISKTPITLAVGAPIGLGDETGADIRSAFAIARLIAERDAAQEHVA